MGQNLFNIEEKYIQLMDEIEELEGELTPELENELAINFEELEGKLKAYHYIISVAKGETTTIDDEIKRLQEVKKSKGNLIERLKKSMLGATMLYGDSGKTGNKKLKFDTIQMWTRKTESVQFSSEEEFALKGQEYINYTINNKLSLHDKISITSYLKRKHPDDDVVITATPDKKLIKDEIKGGVEIPGVYLERKDSLTIK